MFLLKSSSASGKESACQCRRCGLHPWVKKIPWTEEPAGYNPWGCKKSDRHDGATKHIEVSPTHFLPLAHLCPGAVLEKPRDRCCLCLSSEILAPQCKGSFRSEGLGCVAPSLPPVYK